MSQDKYFVEQYEQETDLLPVKGKKRRKKLSVRIYQFLTRLMAVAILLLAGFVFFYIQEIKVSGNTYTPAATIEKTVCDDDLSFNSLYVMGKYLFGRGRTLPALDGIRVGIRAPWSLRITVTEKPLAGYATVGEEYLYFDKTGMLVARSADLRDGVPHIEGLNPGKIELYETLQGDQKTVFTELLKATELAAKEDIKASAVKYVDNSIYLIIDKVYVRLGSRVSTEQLGQIKPIVAKLNGQEGTLHLEHYQEGTETIMFKKGEKPSEN